MVVVGGDRGFRRHRDEGRRVDRGDGHFRQQAVRRTGGVHAVGEQEGVVRTRRDQRARAAEQRAAARQGGEVAGGAGDVAEAEGAGVGPHFVDQPEDVDRNDAEAELRQALGERAVVADGGQRGERACGGQRPGGELRGGAEVGKVQHDDVASAGGLQAADLLHHRGGDRNAAHLRVGRGGGRVRCPHRDVAEQVVGAHPDGEQRVGVGDRGAAGEVEVDLLVQARHREGAARGRGRAGGHAAAGAAEGEVGAAGTRQCRGQLGEPEIARQQLDHHRVRVGGEALAGAAGRVRGEADVAGIGEAVAEAHDAAEALGVGRRGGEGQRDGADEETGAGHRRLLGGFERAGTGRGRRGDRGARHIKTKLPRPAIRRRVRLPARRVGCCSAT